MGNEESYFSDENQLRSGNSRNSADVLQQQLRSIEQAIQNIESSHCSSLSELATGRTQTTISNKLKLFGVQVDCSDERSILLGPIVGRVTARTVVLLVEVDQAGPVTVYLSRTDLPTNPPPLGKEVCRVTQNLKARVPSRFEVASLEPGARYAAVVGGVKKEDAQKHIAHFWTLPNGSSDLRLLLFGADHPGALRSGECSLWEVAAERLEAFSPIGMREAPGSTGYQSMDFSLRPQLAIHLGGTTRMKEAFEEAWALLKTTLERQDLMPGEWKLAEQRAAERLREVYRFTWNLRGKQKVLGTVGNLVLLNDRDVYPDFQLHPELCGEKAVGVASCLLRICRRVTWEYTHQLNGSDAEGTGSGSWGENQDHMIELTFRSMETRRKAKVLDSNLKKANAALQILKESDPRKVNEDDLSKAERRVLSLELTLGRTKTELEEVENELGTLQTEHERQLWSFHTFPDSNGTIGLFSVDTIWTRCRADGLIDPFEAIVSNQQLDQLHTLLRHDSQLRLLVVALGTALTPVQTHRSIVSKQSSSANRGTGGILDPSDPWVHSSSQRERLLEILFGWLRGEKWREVVILAGGSSCPLETDIYDTRNTQTIRQVALGPVTEQCLEFKVPHTGWIDALGYYKYEHFPYRSIDATKQRAYCEMVLRAANNEKAQVQLDFQGIHSAKVNGVVGPVIGRVTHCTAIVLLEVDHTAPITCYVRDTLGGTMYQQSLLLKRLKPQAFYFTGLQAGRDYAVYFEGIEDRFQRTGGFTTLRQNSEDFKFAFLSHPQPREMSPSYSPSGFNFGLGDQTANSEGIDHLAKLAKKAWGPIDLFFHLGNQVCLDGVMDEVRALLVRADVSEGAHRQALEAAASERLRDGYRNWWSFPHTRQLLAHQSHTMLCGAGEAGGAFVRNTPHFVDSRYVTSQLRKAAAQAFRDYQRQLWEPLDFARKSDCSSAEEDGEWQLLFLGPDNQIAIFILDLKGQFLRLNASPGEMPLISEQQWKALASVLSRDNVKELLLVSEFPLVDDSIGDALSKANSVDSADVTSRWPYHGAELLKLSTALMHWKTRGTDRQVIFIAGNTNVGFETTISSTFAGQSFKQYVSGPLCSQVDSFSFDVKGNLSDEISYQHGKILERNNFLIVRLSKVHTGYSINCSFGEALSKTRIKQKKEVWDLSDLECFPPAWMQKLIQAQVHASLDKNTDGSQSDMVIVDILTEKYLMSELGKLFEFFESFGETTLADFEDFSDLLFRKLQEFYFLVVQDEFYIWITPPATVVIESILRSKFTIGEQIILNKNVKQLELLDKHNFVDFCIQCFVVAGQIKNILQST